ncbi:MAG TPA: hypothetical protein VK949_09120 [Methylotenera sp.]|nr:hypothetical protein [Methylotenera sp.]
MSADPQNIEQQKYDLALKLENEKWKMKKEELEYLEAGQHLRSLNQLMWQVPGIAIAITGGLWFGAASLSNELVKQVVFSFTAFLDFLTIITLHRLRSIIQLQIDIQNAFSIYMSKPVKPEKAKKTEYSLPNKTVIRSWTAALFGAVLISILAAFMPPSISKSGDELTRSCGCCCQESPNKETHETEPKKETAPDKTATSANQDAAIQESKKAPQVKKHILKTKTICKT